MSETERRFRFLVHEDIQRDIEDVEDHDPDQAADLLVLIEDMHGDRRLCERLIEVGYEDEQIRYVKEFKAVHAAGYNAYSVRCWDSGDWRVISAVDYKQRLIAVVYIMKRSEDYDDLVQERVIAACDDLGISKYRGQ